ncbi:hypothetical protein V6N13_005400 [Hibiscus sabdariffa]
MYVGECQDSSYFNEELIQGNLLICSYSIQFVNATSALDLNQSPATPFDMGSGFVNATSALDPGLIPDSMCNFLQYPCLLL